jgi:hypothetical protein
MHMFRIRAMDFTSWLRQISHLRPRLATNDVRQRSVDGFAARFDFGACTSPASEGQ